MKRTVTLILSLTLVWLQMVATASIPGSAARASEPECGCCTTTQSCGCVAPVVPASQPVPAVPVPSNPQTSFIALLPKGVVWTLSQTTRTVVSSSEITPLQSSAVPLFVRHCAYLI